MNRLPSELVSTPPSPRTDSVTSSPRTEGGHTMPVGCSWTNSMFSSFRPERVVPIVFGQFLYRVHIWRDHQPLARLRQFRLESLRGRFHVLHRFRLPVEELLENLADEGPAEQPTSIGVGQDHPANALLRQPEHVTMETYEVAAMVHDRNLVFRVDAQSHPVDRVLPNRHLRRAPRQEHIC